MLDEEKRRHIRAPVAQCGRGGGGGGVIALGTASPAAAQAGAYCIFDQHSVPVADQAAVLTMVMNPTTLRRVYDNELGIPSSEGALTLTRFMFGEQGEN